MIQEKNKLVRMFVIFLILLVITSYIVHAEISKTAATAVSTTSSTPTPKPPKPTTDHNMIKDLSSDVLNKYTPSGTYTTDLFTGSATYFYPIEVPPGVNGLEPEISISYNHHQAALKGILGNRWSLSQNYIYRDINGTLSNKNDDVFILNFNGVNNKLVYSSTDKFYHTETETFWKIEKKTTTANQKGEYWTLKTKDGTTYRFGYNQDSEFVSNLESFVSIWSLDLVNDTHGNLIKYIYNKNLGSDYYPYLININYNKGINLIKFNYNTNSFNGTNGYFYGTEIRQNALLNNIEIRNSGSLVKRYKIEYQTIDYKKFISKIKIYGSDDVSQLPPTIFSYDAPEKGWLQDNNYNIPSEAFFGDNEDKGVRLIDINGDGFDDIILMNNTNDMSYWLNNKNNGWKSKQTYYNLLEGGIINNDGADQGVRFFDLNGDAKVDIVKLLKKEAPIKKVLINTGNNWQEKNVSVPRDVYFVTRTTIQDSCVPSACPSGYSDDGITCKQGICNRTCYILECYDTISSRDLVSNSSGGLVSNFQPQSQTYGPLQIKKATLYVYYYWKGYLNATNPLQVYETNNFEENSVTWNNQPSTIGFVNQTFVPSNTGVWLFFDVTNNIKNKSEINFKLKFRDEKSVNDNSISILSRHYGYINGRVADPYLKIEYTDNSTKEVNTIGDAEVLENYPDSNYGVTSEMWAINKIGARNYIYLKFNSLQYCKPDCVGKACGPDGCGGYCGFCSLNSPYCFNKGVGCGTNGPCTPTNYSTCCYCAIPTNTINCNECLIGYFNTRGECDSGQEKCSGNDYYLCENNYWANKGKIVGKCGYLPNGTRVYFRTSDLSYGNKNCWSGAGGWIMFSGAGYCGQDCASSGCPSGIEIKNFPRNNNDTYATRVSKDKLCITRIYRNSWGQAIGQGGRLYTSPCSSAITTETPNEPYKSDGRETYGEHCGDGICMANEIGECPNIKLNYTYNDQICGYFPSQYNDTGVRLADINGDGKTDFIKLTNTEKKIWINNDNTFSLANWTIPSEAVFLNSYNQDEGTRIMDVNGDGLPDLIKGKDSTRITWLNNGKGFVQNSKWTLPNSAVFISNYQDMGVVLVDVNGDGLVDILRAGNSIKKVWINTGGGWLEDSGWSVPVSINFTGFSSTIADINGDGLSDLLVAGSVNNRTILINKAQKNYKLSSIKNMYGGTTSISYTKISGLNNSGNDSINDLPFNGWVVSSITTDNNLTNNFKVISTTSYNYSGGLYDSNDREFRGFNYVEEILPDKRRINHYFHQDKARKGLEYESIILDSNKNPYYKIQNEFLNENKGGYYVVKLVSEKAYTYDGSLNSPKITQRNYEYDNYGNIIKISDLGDLNMIGDERYQYTDYVYNTGKWILDKASHAYLSDSNNNKIRESWYNYDNQNNGANPTKGDLTKKEGWLNTGGNIITNYTYDSYGNLILGTDSNNHKTKYVYDSTNTFIIKEINAKNQEYNYQYNFGTGNLLSEKDPNNFIITYKYDVFGREIKEILPYDSETYPTIQISYEIDGTAPEKIKLSQRETSGTGNTYDTYNYYDGIGNLVQEKSESERTEFITNSIYYNEKGLVKEESLPYYSSTSDFALGTGPSFKYYYDILNRITKIINPDSTQRTIDYNHWLTSTYDENNHRTDYLQDAYNNIIQVKEYNKTSIYVTYYEYSFADELVGVTDNQSNKIKYSYDSLGRKIKLEDPDLGIWQYKYDKVGNLIKQIDSKGNNLSLEYDELDRISKKITKEQIIIYRYDENVKGVLSSVKDNLLTINYTYDNRLRKIREGRIINNTNFITTFNYDPMSRLTSVKLPDGKIINYKYNTQNELDSIEGYLTNIDYNPLNQPIIRYYSNNLQTNLTYNTQNFRLTRIKTANKQDLNYIYDNEGNTIQIKDMVNNATSSFAYDSLDRLVKAARIGRNNYNITYVYDRIGNILKIGRDNSSSEFTFSTKPAHAPIRVKL